jgi:hypothetical protein
MKRDIFKDHFTWKGGDNMEGLTPGRVVHYVAVGGEHLGEAGAHLAATVATINEDETANLQVYDPMFDGTRIRRYVEHSEDPRPGTWHWIERA